MPQPSRGGAKGQGLETKGTLWGGVVSVDAFVGRRTACLPRVPRRSEKYNRKTLPVGVLRCHDESKPG